MTRRFLFVAGILSMVLIFAMIFITCDDGSGPGPGPGPVGPPGPGGPTNPIEAAKPVVTDQSGSKRYITGSAVEPLSVTATVSDGGTLSYQWYSSDAFASENGTLLDGETAAAYAPSVSAAGTTYYYVVVTNTITDEAGETKTATAVSAPIGVIVLAALPAADATVTVTATQNQYVRGFGGMSNAFAIGNAANPARYMEMADIETMFGPNGLGLKFLRIMIWPNPLSEVISGQVQPQMNNAATYLPAVRKVNEYGGYVLASPWTPPEHYKTNAAAGGHLKENMYADYANYLRTFASEMAGYNAPIYAISLQNEPSLEVGYDGMEWTPAEHRNFLRDYGNFTRLPSPVKGYGAGKAQDYVKAVSAEAHQVGNWYTQAMDMVINDTAAYANMDIAAYHIYGGAGNYNQVTRNGSLGAEIKSDGLLGKETWMTEYNINSQNEAGYYLDSTWDYVWLFAETVHNTIANNNSSVFVWWYLKRFYCVIGDGSYGTINGAVMPRGYALSHYAKYATDTVRVNATTTHPGGADIRLTAYQRKTTKENAVEKQLMADEDSYSVVVYDKRTTTGNPTSLRISLPAGFVASRAFGIISDSTGNRHAPLDVALNPDGNSADVTLPVNAIISVKFVK